MDAIPAEWRDAMLANAAALVRELDGGTGEHFEAARLRQISAQTIVLAGRDSDPAFEAASRRIAAAIPGARFRHVEGSAHTVQFDRPADIAAAVAELLRR